MTVCSNGMRETAGRGGGRGGGVVDSVVGQEAGKMENMTVNNHGLWKTYPAIRRHLSRDTETLIPRHGDTYPERPRHLLRVRG